MDALQSCVVGNMKACTTWSTIWSSIGQQFGQQSVNNLVNASTQDDSAVTPRGPPKSITVEDSFKSCDSNDAALRVLRVLLPDLVARLMEDSEEHRRWPGTLTIRWRHRGSGHHRSGASSGWPAAVHAGLDPGVCEHACMHVCVCVAAVAHSTHPCCPGAAAAALERPCMALLAQHCPAPFDLTLINVGACNFVPLTAGRLRGAGAPPIALAGGEGPGAMQAAALEAMRRDYSVSSSATAADQAIASKRQERALREGRHLGGSVPNTPTAAPCVDDLLDAGDEECEGFWDDLHAVEAASRTAPAPVVKAPATPKAPAQRVVLHVDCDCFYVACERRDDPTLVGKPVAVQQFNSGGFVSVSYEV